MKSRWGYIAISTFALVMLGLLIAEGRPQPPATADDVVPLTRLFPEIDIPQRIIGIEVSIPTQSSQVAIVAEGDPEVWRLRDDPYTVLESTQADQARQYLGFLPTAGSLNPDDQAESDFGFLPNPLYVVRFQLEDLSVATLYVGSKNTKGDMYFVSSAPKGAIVDLVPVNWMDTFVTLMATLKPAETQADEIPTVAPR